MGSEVAPRVIEGRVLRGGVARVVTRQDGYVRIALTCMPGYPLSEDGVTRVAFEPVPVPAGTWVHLVIEWLPSGSRDDAGPVWMPVASVLDCAHVTWDDGGRDGPRPSAPSRRRGSWRSRS